MDNKMVETVETVETVAKGEKVCREYICNGDYCGDLVGVASNCVFNKHAKNKRKFIGVSYE